MPNIGWPVPDQENVSGFLKPVLVVETSDENDNWDDEDSAIFANDIGAGGVWLLKSPTFGKMEEDFVAKSPSAESQPRQPGQGGASSYKKKLRGSLSAIALRFCSSVASLA